MAKTHSTIPYFPVSLLLLMLFFFVRCHYNPWLLPLLVAAAAAAAAAILYSSMCILLLYTRLLYSNEPESFKNYLKFLLPLPPLLLLHENRQGRPKIINNFVAQNSSLYLPLYQRKQFGAFVCLSSFLTMTYFFFRLI